MVDQVVMMRVDVVKALSSQQKEETQHLLGLALNQQHSHLHLPSTDWLFSYVIWMGTKWKTFHLHSYYTFPISSHSH